jgi:hypothetical protein
MSLEPRRAINSLAHTHKRIPSEAFSFELAVPLVPADAAPSGCVETISECALPSNDNMTFTCRYTTIQIRNTIFLSQIDSNYQFETQIRRINTKYGEILLNAKVCIKFSEQVRTHTSQTLENVYHHHLVTAGGGATA